MTNQFNKILTATGKETGLFANLIYDIRNQNFDGEKAGNANYLRYQNDAWKVGHHRAEIYTKMEGANWFFQETGEKLGEIPLYNIRNQKYTGEEYGNINYLNYQNDAWKVGHYYAEICPKLEGANWFLEETGEKLGTSPLYNIRNQNFHGEEYGNTNYLNYQDTATTIFDSQTETWGIGRHNAEICPKEEGANWFFEVDKASYTMQISVLNMKLVNDKSLDSLKSVTSLGTQTVNNINGNSPLTESLDFSKSFTSSSSYTFSVDCEQSINVKVKASANDIFEKVGLSVDVGLKFSETNSWTHSSSKTTTLSLTEAVTVQPGECSEVTGYYKILKGNQVPFKSTALVSITGTIIDEHGNLLYDQNVPNTEFITQYINDHIKDMTVVDQNYSDTNVKVEISGHMSVNLATMDSYTQEVACDSNNNLEHTEL